MDGRRTWRAARNAACGAALIGLAGCAAYGPDSSVPEAYGGGYPAYLGDYEGPGYSGPGYAGPGVSGPAYFDSDLVGGLVIGGYGHHDHDH